MKALRFIQNWLRIWWNSSMSLAAGPDSHRWESKIEILSCLSGRHN